MGIDVPDKDPLIGPDGSSLPPAPPTAPPTIRVDAAGKHAGPLVAPDGTPIPPTITLDELHHLTQRVGRDVTLLAIGLIVVLIVALIAGWFALDTRSYTTDLDARITAADIERARVDGVNRNATCTVASALRGTYSTASRNAYPLGAGSYDSFYAQSNKAAVTLNCDAG
jgi:hypothetical protein